jgi:preprotein translocase subunit YajC
MDKEKGASCLGKALQEILNFWTKFFYPLVTAWAVFKFVTARSVNKKKKASQNLKKKTKIKNNSSKSY